MMVHGKGGVMTKEQFNEMLERMVEASLRDPDGKHPAWTEIDRLTQRISSRAEAQF